MRIRRDRGTATSDQEIEIGPGIGLRDVRHIAARIVAVFGDAYLQARTSFGKDGIGNIEVKAPPDGIEFDHIAIFHQDERPARRVGKLRGNARSVIAESASIASGQNI